jgi:kynureninase
VDAYHALGAIPFRLADHGLEAAFVVGGGYKYLQLGEGNCFLRMPPDCRMRPVVTGWYSEFADRAELADGQRVAYGKGGARFAGATYDPTANYRAAAVMDFFAEHGLVPGFLREVSEHQVTLLADTFRTLDLRSSVVALDESVRMEDRGGFLALKAPRAVRLSAALRERGVYTDARGAYLRFGPAPYLTDAQLVGAMQALEEVVRG